MRRGLNWVCRRRELLRSSSAGRRNRLIEPEPTAPSLEDGTVRSPTLVPALEQDPAGAKRIVGVAQQVDDPAKRPTPPSELRHLGGLRRAIPFISLTSRSSGTPTDRARPDPARPDRANPSKDGRADPGPAAPSEGRTLTSVRPERRESGWNGSRFGRTGRRDFDQADRRR